MSKVWKEVKIYVFNAVQSVNIATDTDSLVMRSMEENGKDEDFFIYMTPEEAEAVADELIRFAQEMKSNQAK